MDLTLRAGARVHRITLPMSDGRRLAWLHSHGEVVGQTSDDDSFSIDVRLSDKDKARFDALN
jgi:GTP-binding protein HflX